MTPAVSAWRFGCSLLLGSCLGLFYGFLRPLARKHQTLADLLFSLGVLWVWIYICFGICLGDIRTVYLLAMGTGIFLWDQSFGRWLRPVFSGFWRFIRAVTGILLIPWKKNFGNCKNFVCIWGKMGYNRVYENFQFAEKAEETIPWQKNKPRPKL